MDKRHITVARPVIYFQEDTTLDKIRAVIQADPNLTLAQKLELVNIMTNAYNELVKGVSH